MFDYILHVAMFHTLSTKALPIASHNRIMLDYILHVAMFHTLSIKALPNASS